VGLALAALVAAAAAGAQTVVPVAAGTQTGVPGSAPALVPQELLRAGPALRPRTELAARRATPLATPAELEREAARARRQAWGRAFQRARTYARGRLGRVSFALVDDQGQVRSFRGRQTFFSASLVKAMLLVAYLRQASVRDRPLSEQSRALLGPMITRSDNDAATAVRNIVGNPGLAAVARRAGMHWFASAVSWGDTQVAALDQAVFFYGIDSFVPARHRAYVRQLLSGVIAPQRWGIPEVAPHRAGVRVYFKGGWRPSAGGWIVNQAALVEVPGGRVALAVLTDQDRTEGYGHETVRGVAARVLAPLADAR
jgi:hypothetical protein